MCQRRLRGEGGRGKGESTSSSSINLPRAIEQFDGSYESATSGVYRTIESIRANNRGAKEATRSFLSPLPHSCAPPLENNEEETAGSLPNTAMHPRKLNAEEKKEEEDDVEKRSRRRDGGCKMGRGRRRDSTQSVRVERTRNLWNARFPAPPSPFPWIRIVERHYAYQSWKPISKARNFPRPDS